MLVKFTQKIAKIPSVRAVIAKEDKVTVLADKPQAALYLRVTSLVEGINKRLVFGKHIEAEVREVEAEEEFQRLLRQTGVLYVRDDAPSVPIKSKK